MYYKAKLNSTVFTLLLAVYFVVVINLNLNVKIYAALNTLESVKPGLSLAIAGLMVAFFNIIFSLITIKYLTKPLSIVLILLSSIVAYQAYYYGVIFDKDMITNVFETHSGEALAFFNFHIAAWVLVIGVLPSLIIYKSEIIYKNFFGEVWAKSKSIFLSLLVLSVIFVVYYKDIASVGRNNSDLRKDIIPTYFVSGLYKYLQKNYLVAPKPYRKIGLDAKMTSNPQRSKNNLLVLVVGETARSMNQQLNGYHRDTNYHTKNYDMVSFQNVSSCGTSTAISVPCMFSRLNRKEYKENIAKSQDNVLDIVKRAGANVIWLDNDGGCKGQCENITYTRFDTKKSNFCDGIYCIDEVLVDDFKNRLTTLPNQDTVIVLHIIGSHGPTYYKRYPESHRRYTPDCQRSDIQNCSSDQLVNTYDNTIAYTDYILSETIKLLIDNAQNWNTAMLYVSDHGESLGEYGLYLHGSPYFMAPSQQTKVPMMAWLSDSFVSQNKLNIEKIKNKAKVGEYSHDNLFDSVLGLMNVNTDVYKPELDIFTKNS